MRAVELRSSPILLALCFFMRNGDGIMLEAATLEQWIATNMWIRLTKILYLYGCSSVNKSRIGKVTSIATEI